MTAVPIIRTEDTADYNAVRRVVAEAFARAEYTDGDEHNLVDRLRMTEAYIPALSLVAVVDGEIVGHIMFSRVHIGTVEAIALAPLAVLPAYQHRGIGLALIQAGHRRAQELGYSCSVVLGAPGYYAKSGYVRADISGIRPPFDVAPQYYMVCPLNPPLPRGTVRYSCAFGGLA